MSRACSTLSFVAVACLAFSAAPARAQEQSAEQQRCIRILDAQARKLADKIGVEWFKCIRDAALGVEPDLETCAAADRDEKVSRALLKLTDLYVDRCTGENAKGAPLAPDFGVTDPETVRVSAEGVERNLHEALFGSDADPVLLSDKAGRTCQSGIAKSTTRCQSRVLKEYGKCAKTTLRGGTADATSLEQSCLEVGAAAQPDPKGRIAALCETKVDKDVANKCEKKGVSLASAAPGCNASDADSLETCIEELGKCQGCLHVNAIADLARDCDLFDDGVADGSCPPGPSFDVNDVNFLAVDALAGRDNATPGSADAREFLIQELSGIARGLDASKVGIDAYLQPFNGGTNVLAVIPGSDLAGEYVMVGAHYDHLSSCAILEPGDTVCNGATDNAAGVANVLSIARSIVRQPTPPRRSVILAFWDREEDGLVGSAYYVNNAIVPIADTVAYVNFDIQGANLSPGLRNFSVAVGAETGGTVLPSVVDSAIATSSLGTVRLSTLFGQGRSDYVNLVNAGVPSVFFTDATGGCYHTNQDEIDVVDFDKLALQSAIGLDVTRQLASMTTPPPFTGPEPGLATFADALSIQAAIDQGIVDAGLLSPGDQALFLSLKNTVDGIVAAGPAAFPANVGDLLLASLNLVSLLTRLPCDGYLVP